MSKNSELSKEMGERIRKIRNEMKLTKDALGKKLGVTGQFLGIVESGRSTMAYDKLKKLCEISNYSADFILFGKEPNLINETKELLQDFTEDQIQNACDIIMKMANIMKENKEDADETEVV